MLRVAVKCLIFVLGVLFCGSLSCKFNFGRTLLYDMDCASLNVNTLHRGFQNANQGKLIESLTQSGARNTANQTALTQLWYSVLTQRTGKCHEYRYCGQVSNAFARLHNILSC